MKIIRLFFISFTVFAFLFVESAYATNYQLKYASKKAIKKNKLLLITISNATCYYCKKMEKDVFGSKRVIKKIKKKFERVTFEAGLDEIPKFLQAEAYPTNFIVNPKNFNVVDEYIGYMKPKQFLEVLNIVYNLEVTCKNVESN